jgi:hypothetical protein
MEQIDLVEAERRSFRAATDTGLWDIMIAAVVSMLAIAPYLSRTMGDFWSSAVFVPVFMVVYLVLHVVRRRIVVPRVGTIRIGRYRKQRLRRVSWVMLGVNMVALVAGIVAATRPVSVGVWTYPLAMGAVMLVGFSLAAYYLDVPRYFVYGLMLVAAPALGEWLFQRGWVPHHGFPAVFGGAAVLIALSGVIRFVRVVPFHGPPPGADSGNDR